MLKPTTQQEGITPRERHLARLARKSFFGLWSYPNLYRDEGITKNRIGQELTDLTVIFGNTVILFSEKDIAWPNNDDLLVNWGRWYRKSVCASAKQLHGAEQFIRNHPTRIFLDKNCKENLPFQFSIKDIKVHLVAVTNNTKYAASAYFNAKGAGSTPSLMCNFDLPQESILENPFFVTDISPEKTFIHVLDEITLDLLMHELDTISDFIHYLFTKEKAVRKLNLRFAAGEEEILGYYLQERTHDGYGDIALPKKLRKDSSTILMIPEGEWVHFKASENYKLLAQERTRAVPWASLLDLFSRAVLCANTDEANDIPFEVHEIALRCMASENRASRAALCDTLFEKYNSVPPSFRSARLARTSVNPNRLYIFLFFPHGKNLETYSAYRGERRAAMEMYVFVARFKFPDIKEILVLGSDTKGSPISSETVIYVDTSIPLNEYEKEQAKEIMVKERILHTVQNSLQFSPAGVKRLPNTRRKHGRNDPCLCGSGKKNKKCCNLSGRISKKSF